MNPDQLSREQIEARLTALLLGELPADEAELLRWTISQDAELQKLHNRLKSTIGFMREAVKPSADAPAPKEIPLKLSPERRQKLLAHFKTPRANKLFWLKRIEVPTLVPVLAVLAVIALIVAITVPNFVKARSTSQANAVINNVRQLDAAKNEWALVNKKSPADVPTPDDLKPYLKGYPKPVMGETYVLGRVSDPVTTDVDAKQAGKQFGSLFGSLSGERAEESLSVKQEDARVLSMHARGTRLSGTPAAASLAPPPPVAEVSPGGIVLPETEPPPAAGSVYSQAIVGYTALPNNSSAPITMPADSLFPGNAGAINGIAGGSSGGGGTGGTTTANRTALAWDVSGAGSVSGKVPSEASDHGVLTGGLASRSEPAKGLAENGAANSAGAPAAAAMLPSAPAGGSRKELFEFDSGAPALSGNNSPAGGVSGAIEPKPEVAKDGSSDANGARLLLQTNTVLLADSEPQKSPEMPAPSSTLTQEQLQNYNNQTEITERGQPYWESKRKLDNMVDFHKLLAAKIEAEKLDLSIPKSSTVEITDAAGLGQSQSAWQKLTGEVESNARIRVESDTVADIAGVSGSRAVAYDPYFVQTTLEEIQSDAVLGKVVDALKLDETWAKNNGEKLKKEEAIRLLKKRLDLKPVPNTKLVEIGARSDKPEEAAKIANAVAESFRNYSLELRRQMTAAGIKVLEEQLVQQEEQIRLAQAEVDRLGKESHVEQADQPLPKPSANAPVPQPEILTRDNAFSTFSLNVSDVSFKLAAASLEKGRMPDAASIRSEEFINAFDYRDPEAAAGQPLAFTAERARYPFAHNRELLRFSIKTAAAGRQAGRPLNLVLLLDTSGSMERADRVVIIREALRVLAAQLQPQDTVSVVTFARTARLWADGVPGDQAGEVLGKVSGITPEGGTNLEEAMRLAYETARRHYLANGINRVVMLTDGAANLGNVDPNALKQKVEANRRQGIALDCFGIGWEGYNDDLLEQLSSNGDGRYAFMNSPDEAAGEFAAKLAGALQVAAQDVKVQVEFNPQRVVSYRQIGYAKHQLTKEQFRDNSVAAGEIAAQEAGNALYTIETKPDGAGPIATVRVRYRVPGTPDYRERSWDVDSRGNAPALEQSSAAMRLAATASAFSEWLASSPFAGEVTPDQLLNYLSGVPAVYGADPRPKQLEWMIRQAKSVSGK